MHGVDALKVDDRMALGVSRGTLCGFSVTRCSVGRAAVCHSVKLLCVNHSVDLLCVSHIVSTTMHAAPHLGIHRHNAVEDGAPSKLVGRVHARAAHVPVVVAQSSQTNQVQVKSKIIFIRVEPLKPGAFNKLGSSLHRPTES